MTLKLNGSSSGYTAIDAPASAGSNTLVLPADNGSANEVLKTDGSGNLDWVAQTAAAVNTPAFHVNNTGAGSSQSIPNTTATKVVWATEVLDTANNFASDKFTPTTAGYYWMCVNLLMDYGEAEDEYGTIYIKKNGTSIFEARQIEGVGTLSQSLKANFMVEANGSGDYFEVWVDQHSGDTTVIDKNPTCTWWNGFKLIGVS